MALEVARAEQFYAEGAELMDWLEPAGRRIFGLMMATYRALLRKIARHPAAVFQRRVRLTRSEEAPAARPLVAVAAAKGRLAMSRQQPGDRRRRTGGAGGRQLPRPERGMHVELFEQSKSLGGRAGSFFDSEIGQLG